MALHSGSFQHRSWDSGFYFLFQFCVRFSVIVRFLQNASFEIGSSPLPPPPLSDAPLKALAHSRACSTAWECVRVSGEIRLVKSPGMELDGEECKAKV